MHACIHNPRSFRKMPHRILCGQPCRSTTSVPTLFVQYLSFLCEAFSWMVLGSSSFSLFHSGKVFHELVCPLTVVLPHIFFYLFHAPFGFVVHFPVFLKSFRFKSFLSSLLLSHRSTDSVGMSTFTHPLQHISGKDHDRRLRRSRRHFQHWRQNNHQPTLCWWHRWLSREEEELAKSVERLDKASTAYGMEISAEKTKMMTNNTSGINTDIKVNGQKLETITSIKYLDSVITNKSSKPEILSRIAQTTAALTRLKPV